MIVAGPRTRSRNGSQISPYNYAIYSWHKEIGGSTHVVTNATYTGDNLTQDFTETCDDVVTPEFKKRVAEGEIINNPFSKSRTERIFAPRVANLVTSGSWRSGSYWMPWYQSVIGAQTRAIPGAGGYSLALCPTLDAVDYENLLELALTSAAAKINTSQALAAVSIAESKKTVVSLYAILKRVVALAWNIGHGNFRKLAKELSPKELSDRYMEFRYALRPLYYDFKNLAEAIQRQSAIGERVSFRSGSNPTSAKSTSATVSNSWTQPGSGIIYKDDFMTYNTVAEAKVRAGFLTEITNISPFEKYGFDDVLESIWELVPLSFVVDWFVNVGNTIAAWTPEYSLNTLASWKVLEVVTTKTANLTSVGFRSSNVNDVTLTVTSAAASGCYSEIVTSKVRTPNPALAVWPKFKVRLDQLKFIDLAIILKQIMA